MNKTKLPITLAIDTSCDETATAVVQETEIRSNVVASQVDLHKPYGGVFPTVAKQAHKEQIWQTVAAALKQTRVKPADITEVVATIGPGLAPALEVGIGAGVALATAWKVPFRPANHLEGHLQSVLATPRPRLKKSTFTTTTSVAKVAGLSGDGASSAPSGKTTARQGLPVQTTDLSRLPALGIIVSGGHTAFFRITAPDKTVVTTSLQLSVKLTQVALELTQYLTPQLQSILKIDPLELDFSKLKITPVMTDQTILDRIPNLSLTTSNGRPWLHSANFEYQLLGSTLDDAAGEALDKIGRMLNLGYPAGPVVEEFAKRGNPKSVEFPLPLTQTKSFDMSFSGIKTFSRNYLSAKEAEKHLTKQEIYNFAASLQYAVFRHICYKLNKLIISRSPEESFTQIWLGGGVAANATLRTMIRQTAKQARQNNRRTSRHSTAVDNTATNSLKPTLPLLTPYTKKLYGDNAGMVGVMPS